MSLALFNLGETRVIIDFKGKDEVKRHLQDIGFVKGERVRAEDKVPVVLFPLGIPNFKTAVDRAIEKNPCSVALSDVVITQLNQAFIFGQIGYRVEGTQILDMSQPNCKK